MSNEAFHTWVPHKKANLKTKALHTVRVELHRAIQIVGATGRSYSPPSIEDAYGSLHWHGDSGIMMSQVVGTDQRIYAGLSFSKFVLGIYHEDGAEIDSLHLNGYRFAEAVAWFRKVLNNAGLDGNVLSLDLPYEIPEYGTQSDQEFRFKHKKVFSEFSKLYENAALVLGYYQRNNSKNATEMKCWPHHFDLAIQLIYDVDGEPDQKNYIGLGFSPGDDTYKRPYYYINLWPYPDIKEQDLPSFQGGSWNTKGWFGAALDIKSIKKTNETVRQTQLVKDFYDITLKAIFKLINKET